MTILAAVDWRRWSVSLPRPPVISMRWLGAGAGPGAGAAGMGSALCARAPQASSAAHANSQALRARADELIGTHCRWPA
jgi:hypothetical protein